MQTVTAEESGPAAAASPARGSSSSGLGLEPLGGSLGWSYETRSWRLGRAGAGGGRGSVLLRNRRAWLPYDGNVSPYLGAGLGIVGQGDDGDGDGAALGTKLEAGAEFFRLHRVRLIAVA